MADTIDLPGTGPVQKKYVMIGGVVLAGTLGYAYYRNRRAAAAAAVTAPSDSSVGVDPSIDPATGVPYASELGSGGADGGVSSYGGSYYGTGQITGYDQYGNPVYSTGITGNLQYTTNSGWATQAENDLQAAGYDFTTASQAISRVLAGLTVTSAQDQMFLQAVGLDGQPPQGYPTPVKIVDSPAQPVTTPSGGGSTTLPAKTTVPAKTITVPKGATLTSIARQYLPPGDAHDVVLLAHANGLGTGSGLKAGQRLTIPAH